jgi:hypothetical protein
LSLRVLKLLGSSSSVLSTAAFVIVIADAYVSWIIVLSLGSSSIEALDLAVAVFDDVASSSSSRVGNKTVKNNTCSSSNLSCHSVLVFFAFQLLPQRRLHKYLWFKMRVMMWCGNLEGVENISSVGLDFYSFFFRAKKACHLSNFELSLFSVFLQRNGCWKRMELLDLDA